MEQKLEELAPEEKEQLAEYFDFVKTSAQEGVYFKDALDWYLFRYINPLCDRTVMVFIAFIAAVAMFFLVQIINNTFPLIEKVPIVVRAKDATASYPYIRPLKNHQAKTVDTVDNAIAIYLLAVYVANRDCYDYRKGKVEDVNQKFNRLKNTSSFNEYKTFQAFMSKENPASPLNNFGQNVYRIIQNESVTLIKNEHRDYYSKFKNFFSVELPSEAEIRFTAITKTTDETNSNPKEERVNYLAKIKFDFSGADRKAKAGVLNFSVTGYKLYRIK